MNHLRRILAAVVALAGTVLALATAPAAFAKPLPPSDCCTSGAATGPVTVVTGRHDRLADYPDRGRRCPGRGRHRPTAGPLRGGPQDPSRHHLNPSASTPVRAAGRPPPVPAARNAASSQGNRGR